MVTDIELGGETSGADRAQYAKRRFPDLNIVMVRASTHPTSYVALVSS
jgi:hypothetical protein